MTLWIFRKRFAASRARCTVWPRHAAPFFLRFLVFELSFRRWNRIARRAWSRDSKAPMAWIGTRPPLRLPRDRPFDDENDEIDRTSHPFPGIGRYESARSMVGNGVRGKTWFRDDDAIAASENEAASNEPKRASDSDGSIGSRVRTEADRMSQTRLNPRDAKQWLYRATDRPTDQNRQWNTECRGWRPWHRPVSNAVHLPSVCETFFLVSIRRTQETQRRRTIKKLAALEFSRSRAIPVRRFSCLGYAFWKTRHRWPVVSQNIVPWSSSRRGMSRETTEGTRRSAIPASLRTRLTSRIIKFLEFVVGSFFRAARSRGVIPGRSRSAVI